MSVLLSAAILAACASTPTGKKDLLDFLDRDPITRDEVQTRLGKPHASFEHEHVLTYRLGQNSTGYYVAPAKPGWEGVNYDLVLVFDEQGGLRQHNLIAIRAPSATP